MPSIICNSFKQELLTGGTANHQASDTYKLALYTSVLPASTTAYSATGEVSSANYLAGGKNLGTATVSNQSGTATWDFTGTGTSDLVGGSLVWTTVTLAASCGLIYNSSKSNKAVAILDFNGSVSATAGTYTVTLPASGATTSVVRIA